LDNVVRERIVVIDDEEHRGKAGPNYQIFQINEIFEKEISINVPQFGHLANLEIW
jgi:hypothetical protein